MKNNLDKIEDILSGYYQMLEDKLMEKLVDQNFRKKFKTNKGEYKSIEIEGIELAELNINKDKIIHLFSSRGCKLSGVIFVRAKAIPPYLDRNKLSFHEFTIIFSSIAIKYDFDNETFLIEDDINLDYICVSD